MRDQVAPNTPYFYEHNLCQFVKYNNITTTETLTTVYLEMEI